MASRFSKWRAAKASTAIRLRFKSQLVEKIPLFAGLSAKESQQIARLVNEIAVPAGTRLATAGEAGGELFAIIEGEAIQIPAVNRLLKLVNQGGGSATPEPQSYTAGELKMLGRIKTEGIIGVITIALAVIFMIAAAT